MRLFLFSVALFLTGITTTSRAQTVAGAIGSGKVARGATVTGNITLNIPPGLHVNSNQPRSRYAIPTTITLSSSEVTFSPVRYPAGQNKKFSFSNDLINVYEGKVVFRFSVKTPSNFKGSRISIKALVRYQACNDEVCFPPKRKEIVMYADVR